METSNLRPWLKASFEIFFRRHEIFPKRMVDLPDRSKEGTVAVICESPGKSEIREVRRKGELQILDQTHTYCTEASGRAVPCFWKYSKPASRLTNSGFGIADPSARIASRAAGMTSRPIPSAGIRPILSLFREAVANARRREADISQSVAKVEKKARKESHNEHWTRATVIVPPPASLHDDNAYV